MLDGIAIPSASTRPWHSSRAATFFALSDANLQVPASCALLPLSIEFPAICIRKLYFVPGTYVVLGSPDLWEFYATSRFLQDKLMHLRWDACVAKWRGNGERMREVVRWALTRQFLFLRSGYVHCTKKNPCNHGKARFFSWYTHASLWFLAVAILF